MHFHFGNGTWAATWKPGEMTFDELLTRLRTPIRTAETVAEYKAMSKPERERAKDKGGFLAGTLKGTRRKATEVVSRSIITLDGDKLKSDFFDTYETTHRYRTVAYTTHSHVPEAPRARLLIFITRDVTPEEYNAIARYLAADIGIEQIDPCSFKVNQMMHWPTCPSDGEYICRLYDGSDLNPDVFLAAHPGWQDCASLPSTPGEQKATDRQKRTQEDPLTKRGIVGAFCRAHSIQETIATFLPDVYEPTLQEDRYTYIPGEGTSGVVVYDDKFVYSHHATDPAGGQLLNAFDLVRVHRFGDDDPKKSFNDMAMFASQDEETKLQSLQDKRESATEDFGENDDWKKQLVCIPRTTQLANTVSNLMLILTHDLDYANFAFNELAGRVQVTGPLPWDRPTDNKFWRDADTAQLKALLDMSYQCFSGRNHDVCFTKVADDRRFHPIRDYLNALPPWDGVSRVDPLYIEYLGAEDNVYIREAARKPLVAAVARIYHPGTKFDCVPIMKGDQGIGKSTLFAKLGGSYFSDSLSLTDMKDKAGAEKLQGFWILELGELAGMKKADVETVKGFLSRSDDDYRPSYGRVVESHPRQCIIVGSTNTENGFLRDITGNRRFWPIKARSEYITRHSWDLDQATIDQIWAEALHYYNQGEDLRLSPEAEVIAFGEQLAAMEVDDRVGMVEEYLSKLLPENWNQMDLYARREYLSDPDAPTSPRGSVQRTVVSNAEIWCECFGKSLSELKAADSYQIASLMLQVPGWDRTQKIRKLPIYGRQRLYILHK